MVAKASVLDFESSFADTPKFVSLLLSYIEKKNLHSDPKNAFRHQPEYLGQSAALLFFEASTRTKLSFATAAIQSGLTPITFEPTAGGTSMEKGETPLDSILNIAAMEPAVLVIRCGDDLDLKAVDEKVSMPLLNAGWGKQGHPTQALGDALVLSRRWGKLRGKKLLIVGDIRHSRVAKSHLSLLPKLGLQIGVCAPEDFLPVSLSGVERFDDLREGLRWCDAVMALRVQLERHIGLHATFLKDEFVGRYAINTETLSALGKEAMILHPGPVNWGVELSSEISSDSRSQILNQVTAGVCVRRALIDYALGRWKCD